MSCCCNIHHSPPPPSGSKRAAEAMEPAEEGRHLPARPFRQALRRFLGIDASPLDGVPEDASALRTIIGKDKDHAI